MGQLKKRSRSCQETDLLYFKSCEMRCDLERKFVCMVSFVNSGVSIGIGRICHPMTKDHVVKGFYILRILLPQFHHSNLNDKQRASVKFLQLVAQLFCNMLIMSQEEVHNFFTNTTKSPGY